MYIYITTAFLSFQVRVRLLNASTGDGLAPCEETIPHVRALRRGGFVAGERASHIRKSEHKVS